MQKYILAALTFMMFACTLGQRLPKQTMVAPIETNVSGAPQQPETSSARSSPTNASTNPVAISTPCTTTNVGATPSATTSAPALPQTGPRRPRGIYIQIIVGELNQKTTAIQTTRRVHTDPRQFAATLLRPFGKSSRLRSQVGNSNGACSTPIHHPVLNLMIGAGWMTAFQVLTRGMPKIPPRRPKPSRLESLPVLPHLHG